LEIRRHKAEKTQSESPERGHDFDVAGIEHDFAATLPKGATVKLVAEKFKAHTYDAVIYMGGDGTFAEVAKGLMQSGQAGRTALAMLPTGTANAQGKSFGLSAEEEALADNVDVIKNNARCKLDVGHISAIDNSKSCPSQANSIG